MSVLLLTLIASTLNRGELERTASDRIWNTDPWWATIRAFHCLHFEGSDACVDWCEDALRDAHAPSTEIVLIYFMAAAVLTKDRVTQKRVALKVMRALLNSSQIEMQKALESTPKGGQYVYGGERSKLLQLCFRTITRNDSRSTKKSSADVVLSISLEGICIQAKRCLSPNYVIDDALSKQGLKITFEYIDYPLNEIYPPSLGKTEQGFRRTVAAFYKKFPDPRNFTEVSSKKKPPDKPRRETLHLRNE